MSRLITAGSLALLLAANVAAQAPETSPGAESRARPTDEEVVVRGRRLSEIEFDLRLYIRDFLEEIAAPARGGRGYARWFRRVCIGVHNLENARAQYIVDRVSALALEVGLEPGEPGCRPDVNIIFATDAKQLAATMVESHPGVFRPVDGLGGADLGLGALDGFVESDKAVRWWHVSLPVDSRTGKPAIEMPDAPCFKGIHCFPWIAKAGPSRIYSGIRDDLQYVIIIVDVTKLPGTTWQEIADYLAFVSLAQIHPDTDPQAFDSILNVFSNPAAYSGLTDWDRNYVHALYDSSQDRYPRFQANEIVSRIARRELSDAP